MTGSPPFSATRRALLLSAAALAAPTQGLAADDPRTSVRDLLRRAQNGRDLAQMLTGPDAADLFTPALIAGARAAPGDLTALFARDPLTGAGAGAPVRAPRLLALRILRRRRDEAWVEAALRPPGRGHGAERWSTRFILKREGNRWRVDDLVFENEPGTLRDRLTLGR